MEPLNDLMCILGWCGSIAIVGFLLVLGIITFVKTLVGGEEDRG